METWFLLTVDPDLFGQGGTSRGRTFLDDKKGA